MKKHIIITFFGIILPLTSFAQMMGGVLDDDHTKREEAEGKELWEKFKANQISCENLKEDDFEALGEYFMGQMMGDAHPAMNAMMTQMMGEEGEEAMHMVMGKRFSECDPDASYPADGRGFMPMMNMMWGGYGGTGGRGMMNTPLWYGGFGWSAGILHLLLTAVWWLLIIVIVVTLVRWLRGKPLRHGGAFEIVKERYAKGEIGKEEFEEKKRELL